MLLVQKAVLSAIFLLFLIPAAHAGACYSKLNTDATSLQGAETNYASDNGAYTCSAAAMGWTPVYTSLSEWTCEYATDSTYRWTYLNGTSSANATESGRDVAADECIIGQLSPGCLQFASELQSLKTSEEAYFTDHTFYGCDLGAYWTVPDGWVCNSAGGSGYTWTFTSQLGEVFVVNESSDVDCSEQLFCNSSGFGGATTNTSAIIRTKNFTGLKLEAVGSGKISWAGSLDLAGLNISSIVAISNNLVSVDTGTIANLNRPANVTIYDLTYRERPVLYRNSAVCSSGTCTFISYAGGDYSFSVTGFSNYTTGPNSRLFIYDDNDPEGGSQGKQAGDNVFFFANYSNITSGVPITNAIGSCNISFSEAPNGPSAMAYNATSKLWEYNRTISGTSINWNVSCDATGYEPLTTTDNALLSSDVNGTQVDLYAANITNSTDLARWEPNVTPGNDTTEGGNITMLNLNGSSLTDRWAGYFGNISGDLLLTDYAGGSASYLYSWSWNSSYGGVVCASTNSTLGRIDIAGAAGSDIDIAWGFGSVADNGAATFNGSNCSLVFDSTPVSDANYADTGPAGGFRTCAYKMADNPAKADMMFCT
ncbi:hypothetical protein H0O02_01145, partial [Candidatus Micrarchaeota archaeon]|nr:hypothetical protein [Candidatus Micrarchaeota archaeon]